ncbi:unnamed protein product, partial [Symbiodinium sp. CCMP2456]
MAEGLFERAALAADAAAPKNKRIKLYKWDSVAAQLLEPYGESVLDTMSLKQVWQATTDGNKQAAYHSHLCADLQTDAWHVGAGVSTTAAAIEAAIKNFDTENMRMFSREDLYAKVIEEINQLKPVLEKLNVGRGSQKMEAGPGGFKEAKRQKTSEPVQAYTEAEVLEAARFRIVADALREGGVLFAQ